MSNTYESFQYLYPPRPEAKITTKTLPRYNGGAYLASPKFNGSNGVLFLPGDGTYKLYNRHGALMTLYNPLIKFEKLHRGSGWMVSNGEYMNKNKKNEDGQPFNHKFVIFDIIVFNGKQLIGTTYGERAELLEKLYPCVEPCRITPTGVTFNPYLCETIVEDCYKAPNFMGNFNKIYDDLVKIDMFEGLVLKRKDAKLEPCFTEGNNKLWMVKCRKETKNYQF